jgi:hypothetical protein
MSEENVEIVRRYLEEQASEALPLEQLPAWADGFWESDGDYYPARGLPEARPCHGREENRGLDYGVPCGLGGLGLRGQGREGDWR